MLTLAETDLTAFTVFLRSTLRLEIYRMVCFT